MSLSQTATMLTTTTLNETLVQKPTLTPLPPLLPPITDAWVLLALPIITYWSFSLFFHFLDTHDLLAKYRLHTPEELLKRNRVSRREVVRDVIIQQIIQTIMGGVTALFEGVDMVGGERLEILSMYSRYLSLEKWAVWGLGLTGIDGASLVTKVAHGVEAAGIDQFFTGVLPLMGLEAHGNWRLSLMEIIYWYMMPVVRLGIAIFVLDTWQYFLHRLMHESKWLYKTFHARHHRLYVPYAFGALYNHPFEGLLMDTIGAGLGYKISGMGTRGAMVFFCFSTLKTVDDHCGYSLPWDPLQKVFWNNAGYHDVHHQTWGIKTNFSQPFLICWDRWLGTQWTGDTSARYARANSNERINEAADQNTDALNGHATAPAKENGHATNGHATNGKAANGGATNGQATNGSVQLNGRANGATTNGGVNGHAKASNGKAVNGNDHVRGVERMVESSGDETPLRRSTRRRRAAA